MNTLKRIVNIALLFAMLFPFPAWAQQATGSSLGTVTRPPGTGHGRARGASAADLPEVPG